MTIKILDPPVGGTVSAIASKSEAHRLLICAALADEETFVGCPERSEDIEATVNCLVAMGAVVSCCKNGYAVSPIQRARDSSSERAQVHAGLSVAVNQTFGALASQPPTELNCGESGSTLRFLLPVCGALGLNAAFHMGGRLPQRPLSSICDEMESHGCVLHGSSPLICQGQLTSGLYTLPGNISSQFVSGLMLALPLLDGESLISVKGTLESRPYVEITLAALRLFGLSVIEESKQLFRVPGGQVFRSPKKTHAGGDWSNAAFWLSLGAFCQNGVTCTGLDLKSLQGDRAIVCLLERFGANVSCEDSSVTVLPGELRGIDIDAGDTPDLVPVLAAVASAAHGVTTIRNAGRLRIKESDRLSTVTESLTDLGADIAQTEDGLTVRGKNRLTGGITNSFGDHRIAMAAAVLSAACAEPVTICGAEAVRKSYPRFFDDFSAKLGGVYENKPEAE